MLLLVRRAFASYLPASLPVMSRQSYRWEQLSCFFLPIAVACVEANVIAVIAKKAFDAPSLVIAILAAAPTLSNISSVVWTRYIRGRDRVRAVNFMQVGVLLCVALIAFAPISPRGQVLLVLATLAARTLLTGIITARTDIWRNNYPRHMRARVTGRLLTVAAIVVGLTALTVSIAMDSVALEPAPSTPSAPTAASAPLPLPRFAGEVAASGAAGEGSVPTPPTPSLSTSSFPSSSASPRSILAFRVIYLAAAILGVLGVVFFSRVRWRTSRAQLRDERDPNADYTRSGGGARDMLRLLHDDKTYRSFMAAQFALGLPNLAGIPVFILAFDDQFRPSYTQAILLTQLIPLLVPILTLPLWARFLDRMHIVRFRVYHSWVFVLANLLMGLGFALHSLPILYLSRLILGFAYGGGMLAWDLGHHDFARRDLATLYMGIHVTLTGVRGAIAPFLGALLYAGSLAIPAFTLGATTRASRVVSENDPWLHFPGASIHIPALGANSFFLLAAGSTIGALLFLRLDRSLGHTGAKPKD